MKKKLVPITKKFDLGASSTEFRCQACGVTFVEHLGLIGTCHKLQTALKILKKIKRMAKQNAAPVKIIKVIDSLK